MAKKKGLSKNILLSFFAEKKLLTAEQCNKGDMIDVIVGALLGGSK